MIATLIGKVSEVRVASLVLVVEGVGYEVFTTLSEINSVTVGEEKFYNIHEHIREDTHDLYGFSTSEDKVMFEKLLSVNGVGPKVALAIVSGVDNLGDAINTSNTAALQGVPGVGKRVAERIVVDLRNKLDTTPEGVGYNEVNSPVYEALIHLGYRAAQAHEIVSKLPKNLKTDEDRIKWALKELSK